MKQNIHLSLLAFGIAALTIVTTQVHAQSNAQNCAPRAHVVTRLADRFGEVRQSVGLASNNTMVEMFAAPTTGTWSVVATLPNGITCLIASGHSHETLSAVPLDPKT